MCSKLQHPITLHWTNIFLWNFFFKERPWKALSGCLEIKSFENLHFEPWLIPWGFKVLADFSRSVVVFAHITFFRIYHYVLFWHLVQLMVENPFLGVSCCCIRWGIRFHIFFGHIYKDKGWFFSGFSYLV